MNAELTLLCEMAAGEAGRAVVKAVPGAMPGEWWVMDGPHRVATMHGLGSAEHDARFLAAAIAAAPQLVEMASRSVPTGQEASE